MITIRMSSQLDPTLISRRLRLMIRKRVLNIKNIMKILLIIILSIFSVFWLYRKLNKKSKNTTCRMCQGTGKILDRNCPGCNS